MTKPVVSSALRGRLLFDGALRPGHVVVAGGRIAAVELDAHCSGEEAQHLPLVASGLVDLHVHGFGGCDPVDGLADIARALALAGTTGFQPTLFPDAPETLGRTAASVWSRAGMFASATGESDASTAEAVDDPSAARRAREPSAARRGGVDPAGEGGVAGHWNEAKSARAREEARTAASAIASAPPSVQGARVLGLHLEGPFVNPESAGALPRDALATPSLAALRAILGPATGDARGIRTMTIAPELAGARELIDELVRCGIVPSLGHSRATTGEARDAVRSHRAGSKGPSDRPERLGATHLYNAMPRFHHRDAGLAGFALTGGVSYAEIIGDLAHVGPEAIELALRALGPKALCLVSDALPGAGTGCDVFHWRGRKHRVRDGAAYWEAPGGEALAGSATSQLDAVRKLVRAGVVTLEEALTMASEAPARALGLENEIGRLVPGARADLIVLGPEPELELREVWVGGERLVPAAEAADR